MAACQLQIHDKHILQNQMDILFIPISKKYFVDFSKIWMCSIWPSVKRADEQYPNFAKYICLEFKRHGYDLLKSWQKTQNIYEYRNIINEAYEIIN